MKILLLTDRLDRGGAETHITQLALGLSRMGCKVTLLSAGGKSADALAAMGFRHIRLPVTTHNPLRWLLLHRYLIALCKREKFDVLHAHARIPALLLRGMERYGCATVVTVHARFSVSPLSRRICCWGEHTVAVSEDLREYLMREYRVPSERITVISNGIDCDVFRPTAQKASAEYRRVLFASRLDADCSLGAELLLRIAPAVLRQFPHTRIEIAGGGDAFPRILALAEEANRIIGRDAIRMHGYVDDMPTLLRECDVFIGASRAAMEAAACGCAVILCGNEGYLGVLDKNVLQKATLSNLCCRGARAADTYRLQGDLVFLLSDPNTRKSVATEARDEVLVRFGAERMCRETLMLYRRAVKLPFRHTLLIGGYFGCKNLGDDAILSGFLEGIRAIAPDVRVIALTGAPKRDRRRFGIRCVNRRNPFAILFAMLRADAFLCGGGSLLQNRTSNRSLSYYLHLLNVARLCGAVPILYAAGIGPLYGNRARERTAKTLSRCAYISLRDPDSLRLARSLGIERARLHLGADTANLIAPPPMTRSDALLQQHGLAEQARILCLILRGGKHNADERRTVIAAARMLCRRHALVPMLAILDQKSDADATQSAAEILNGTVLSLTDPRDAIALFSSVALVITMRLHGQILATLSGTSAIGIASDSTSEKILSFSKITGQKSIPRDALTVANLVQSAESALAESASMQPIYLDTTADLRKKAKKDLENIIAMIYNIDSTK